MKAKYRFILGRKKTQPDLLELEVYVSRECRVYLNTRYRIPAKYWDPNRQLVSGRMTNYASINIAINDFKNRIEEVEYSLIKKGKYFDKESIKMASRGKFSTENLSVNILSAYNDGEFNNNLVKDSTYQLSKITIKHWSAFINERFGHDIDISELSIELVRQFESYLLKGSLNINSVYLYMTKLQKFCVRAWEEGLLKDNIFRLYKSKKGKPALKEGLTEDDLAKLHALYDNPRLFKARRIVLDKFLFSCYTGLRISDNNALLKKNIKHLKEGLLIDYTTIKTGTHLKTPLWKLFQGKAQVIAQHYLDEYPDIDTLFPPVTNINKKLDFISQTTGLSRITFHIARHTCATLLAEKTGNPYLIMQILGHSSIEMSMNYLKALPDRVIEEINKVDWDK